MTGTPLTLETYDYRLFRTVKKLLPKLNLHQVPLTSEQQIGLQLAGVLGEKGEVFVDGRLLDHVDGTLLKFWSMVHIVARILEQQPEKNRPTAHLLLIAITKYRELVAPGMVDNDGDSREGQMVSISMAIGALTAIVFSDDPEMNELIGLGRAAQDHRKNRQKTAKAVAAAKVERWHPAAKAKARRMREAVPARPSNQIADAIHNDSSIPTPSHEAVVEAVRLWSRDGTIPDRIKKGKK